MINSINNLCITPLPGFLHGVPGHVVAPVDQVEGPEGEGEEDAGVLVDGAGAGQCHVGWDGRA